MKTLYIGGQKRRKNSGSTWKIYMFLFGFLLLLGGALKLTGPVIAEKWINQKGAEANGYAFSVRDVELALSKGEMSLVDLKVYNPETEARLLEVPNLTINFNWRELLGAEKKISVFADKVDVVLSKDFSSEMKRIKAANDKIKEDLYFETLEGKIVKLNIIEKKEDQSRKVIELNEVNVNVKDVSLLSINSKTQFSVTSKISDGGKLDLKGKTRKAEDGRTPWTIQGALKDVPSDIFNKIAGDKLPFSFDESVINADISAESHRGIVTGEIAPEVKRLNLLVERPGTPTRSIARALTDDLTFTLPFTLKDKITLQYEDTYRKLKSYRKYPLSVQVSMKD